MGVKQGWVDNFIETKIHWDMKQMFTHWIVLKTNLTQNSGVTEEGVWGGLKPPPNPLLGTPLFWVKLVLRTNQCVNICFMSQCIFVSRKLSMGIEL